MYVIVKLSPLFCCELCYMHCSGTWTQSCLSLTLFDNSHCLSLQINETVDNVLMSLVAICVQSSTEILRRWVWLILYVFFFLALSPFSLIRDFGKQNTRGNVSKVCVNLRCYRHVGSKSTSHSLLAWRREGHTGGCDWWISIRRVDNTWDWRKFWKRFRECFVFQSRVSTKTVVTSTVVLVNRTI